MNQHHIISLIIFLEQIKVTAKIPNCLLRNYSPRMHIAKAGMSTNKVRYRALLSKGYNNIEGVTGISELVMS